MRKPILFLLLAVLIVALTFFAATYPYRIPLLAQLVDQHRPAVRMPTITTLPDFPAIPLYARWLSPEQKDDLIQRLVNNKVNTMPATSSRAYRVAKFTSTGIFGGFPPTEDQIARLAPNYDNILFGAARAELIPRFKRHNPDLTFFIYIDSGLNPTFKQSDAGGVDSQDTTWIVTNHPEWLLRDKDGIPIRSGGGLSNPGEYWPDPGNLEWQDYFVEKINKLLLESGDQWDGILFDQFIGTLDGHVRYARTAQQVNYASVADYQAAYLEFFKSVASRLPVPIIVNMEGAAIVSRPEFVAEVAQAAGGVENEIFPEEMPMEDLRPYLETVQALPPTVHIRINSKPAGYAGGSDKTLFAYYCYLLIASRDREVYWTYKEGTSDVPHYWYREFDLDLGSPLGDIQFGEAVWSREFERALVIVNPDDQPAMVPLDPTADMLDVTGKPLESPLTFPGRSAMLLIKDPAILP